MGTYNIVDEKLGIGFMFKDKTGDYVIIDMSVSCDGYIHNVSLLKPHASGGEVLVKHPESVLAMEFMGRVNMTPFYKEIEKVDYMYYSKKRNRDDIKILYDTYKKYLEDEANAVIELEHKNVTESEFYRQRWLELDKIIREYLGMEA